MLKCLLTIFSMLLLSCISKDNLPKENIPVDQRLTRNINASTSFILKNGFKRIDSICTSLIMKTYKDSLFCNKDNVLKKQVKELSVKPYIIAVMTIDTTQIEICYVFVDENHFIYESCNDDDPILGFGVSQEEIDYSINKSGIKHKISFSDTGYQRRHQ